VYFWEAPFAPPLKPQDLLDRIAFCFEYLGLPMSDFNKITCNGPAFTQGSLPKPKMLLTYVLIGHNFTRPNEHYSSVYVQFTITAVG
jgi:hypothetical protein